MSGTSNRTPKRPHPPRKSRQRTILVAEDSEDGLAMMQTLLEASGYRVVAARDGREAVAAAVKEHPDLIVLDLELPSLSGLDVTRNIRQHSRRRHVPIIILSGHGMPSHRDMALAAGCDEYLLKPIDFEDLERTVRKLIASNKRR